MVRLALFFLPWAYFLSTVSETEFEHPTNFVFLPLLTFLVLVFTRQMWWKSQPQLETVSSHDEALVLQEASA